MSCILAARKFMLKLKLDELSIDDALNAVLHHSGLPVDGFLSNPASLILLSALDARRKTTHAWMRETLKHTRREEEFRALYDEYCASRGFSEAAAVAYWHAYEDMLDKFLIRTCEEQELHPIPCSIKKVIQPEAPVIFARFMK